jgi:hypothetical protein
MPHQRRDETRDEFVVRNREYQRKWKQIKRTKVRNGDGRLLSQSIVTVPERDPFEPMPGAVVSRRSSLLDAEGNVIQRWEIEKQEDRERRDLWETMAKALAEDLPVARLIEPPPAIDTENLLTVYPIGDHHLGMLSWKHETGSSYDIEIGEALLVGAVDYLVGCANPSPALLIVLGDFLHYDSFDTVTPTSRNLLDADGRYPKVVSAAIRVLRYAIEAMAAHHSRVHVIVEIGNHDPSSTIFMQLALQHIYEANDRITVDISPSHFHYYEFGKVLLGVHHGHGKVAKPADLPGIMAEDRSEAWGRTRYRYWWTGHVHHDARREYGRTLVESVRILPPADAYAHNEGYRAGRDLKAIVYHREFGEVGRAIVNPAMLEAK